MLKYLYKERHPDFMGINVPLLNTNGTMWHHCYVYKTLVLEDTFQIELNFKNQGVLTKAN